MSEGEALRRELLEMARIDGQVRSELVAEGTLSTDGYHPRMAAVHDRHAERLSAIIEEHGWPGRSLVGRDGAEAAWLILQHAIAQPDLMRSALPLLRRSAERDEADPAHGAHLEDRIAFFENRPQRYGTQFDWDNDGELVPWPIEDPEAVDERRAEVGLPPLAEQAQRLRARADAEGERAPEDWKVYRERQLSWARGVGWVR